MNDSLKTKILSLVSEYADIHHKPKEFTQGDKLSYAGRVYDSAEMVNLVDSALEIWLTGGRFAGEFERKLSD